MDDDEQTLRIEADRLAQAVRVALPGWVDRSVRRVAAEQQLPLGAEAERSLADAGRRCTDDTGAAVTGLLALDIDEQRTNPLSLLRAAVVHPTSVLVELGARPVPRDDFVADAFPADVYDLAPATFADVDPDLTEPGLRWGAAKAYVHLRRRRAEGRS